MKYFKEDLFNTECRILMHGCNAQGVMGSGVAKQFKEKYPESYAHYKAYAKALGGFTYCHENNKVTVCLITQEFYGKDGSRYINYAALVSSIRDAIDSISVNYNITFVAIPKIGAGLGGGDWKIIETLLLDLEKVLDIEFYVYEGK